MDIKTINSYDLMAKEYDDETIDFWEKFPISIFQEFQKNTPPGFILDIGSGPGRDGQKLKNQGFNVICLDASRSMIELTLKRGLPSIQSDFLTLPFPNQSFEGVWSYTSLLHIPRKQVKKALKEIHRVLKKDGTFGLGLIEGNTQEYRLSSGKDKPRLFTYYTKQELEKLLKNTGFDVIYYEEFQPNSKKYLHFLAKKNNVN